LILTTNDTLFIGKLVPANEDQACLGFSERSRGYAKLVSASEDQTCLESSERSRGYVKENETFVSMKRRFLTGEFG